MTASPQTQSIRVEYDLPHPPAKVWRTLTEPELLAKWIMANDIRPEVGHRFTFQAEPTPWWDGIVHCEVLELDPPRRLRYSWRSGPAASPLDTEVTWTLAASPSGGTRLILDHAGFRPSDKFAFDGANKGWQHMVGTRLPDVLAAL